MGISEYTLKADQQYILVECALSMRSVKEQPQGWEWSSAEPRMSVQRAGLAGGERVSSPVLDLCIRHSQGTLSVRQLET